ncbi:pheromone-binding protein-related protein 6 [Leptinotarsa decemlineata]|uniref:pheromone-binding protein-related protein 6 n=1 Tax=Leptinotarsa decemlineata TaxID=7539 RepID=UPI000C254A8B|nr:pheromone-binding protein-related protein 6-like [Leptinotarsa decemlineata]
MWSVTKIFLVTFFIWSTGAKVTSKIYDAIQLNELEKWHDVCEDVTGVTDEEVANMQNGNFTEDANQKKYLLCMWRATGVISKDMEFNKKRFLHWLPKRLQTDAEAEMVQSCFDEGKKSGGEKCEQIFKMQQCMHKKDGVNILLL